MVSLYAAIKARKYSYVLEYIKSHNFKGFYFTEGAYIPFLLLTYNHIDALHHILSQKTLDVNYKGIYGLSLLYYATRHASCSVIDHLLDNGADIQMRNDNGLTVISEAIIRKDYEIIFHLITKGYRIQSVDVELIISGKHELLYPLIDDALLKPGYYFEAAYRNNTVFLTSFLKRDLSTLLAKNEKGVRLVNYMETHSPEAYVEITALLWNMYTYTAKIGQITKKVA